MDKKTIITIVLVLLTIGGAYGAYSLRGSSESAGNTLQAVDAQGLPIGSQSAEDQKFLSIITNLKNLKIDTAVLAHPAFRKLTDLGVVLTPEPLRKSNPFVPFGGSGAAAVAQPSQTAPVQLR